MRGPQTIPVEQRFWRYVQKTDTCWLWVGSIRGGYGKIKIKGRTQQAHRVGYEMLVGPIPEGMQLDHLCRVRHCVNPGHLEIVTHRENILRGETITARQAAQTHCCRGHEYDEDNTRIRFRRGYPNRVCRKCERIWNRNRRATPASGGEAGPGSEEGAG